MNKWSKIIHNVEYEDGVYRYIAVIILHCSTGPDHDFLDEYEFVNIELQYFDLCENEHIESIGESALSYRVRENLLDTAWDRRHNG